MSSLKDLASLIMIPSLYKDGRLDTVKPLGNSIIHPDATGNNDGTDGSTPAEGNFTFSRGSNLAATRVDVNGLIEKGRENLFLYSEQFDIGWTLRRTTITANATQNPNGQTTADAVFETIDNNYHDVDQGVSVSSGAVYTQSVYVKGGLGRDAFYIYNNDGTRLAKFNINTGEYIGSAGNNSFDAYDSTDVGNGWFRYSVSVFGSAGGNARMNISPHNTLTNVNDPYAGETTKGIYLWGAQFELGLVATDYIETGASTAQAGILEDMPRLDYSGSCPALLLEPQRTNLLENSEYFGSWNNTTYPVTITSNAATSPDGNTNATLITPTSGNSRHAIRDINVVAVAGTTYTLSAFFKKAGSRYVVLGDSGDNLWRVVTADLDEGTITDEENATGTIEPYENDWYRITCTFTRNNPPTIQTFLGASPNDTNIAVPSFDDTSLTTYVYGAQVEASSSYPTSYIPTYGTSQTRSNESATSPADTLDSLSAFTWFFEISRIGFSGDMSSSALSLRTASGAEQIRCHFDAPSQQIRIRDAINGYTTIGASLPVTAGTYIKICVVSDGETIKTFANGTQRGGAYTIVTQHDVDRVYMNEKGFNCKQLLVFPTALTDSECIALTS